MFVRQEIFLTWRRSGRLNVVTADQSASSGRSGQARECVTIPMRDVTLLIATKLEREKVKRENSKCLLRFSLARPVIRIA